MRFSEWTLTGTTPAGERIELRGTDRIRFRGDKIVRKDSYWKILVWLGGNGIINRPDCRL